MKKKILSLCLVIALAATAIIGGTLAYFTDTEQQTNTMTIGDVEINIEELMKNPDWTEGSTEDKYIDFDEDELTLFPIKNDLGVSLLNKMVYTFNTSSSEYDAYIRTIVLFEYNDQVAACADDCLNGIHFSYSNADYTVPTTEKQSHGSTNEVLGVMTVNGVKYQVVVFTAADENAIPYGEALGAINGVWIDENVTQKQAETWGDDIDIIVFSQAIQSTGLTHSEAMYALGEVTEANLNSWIGEDDAVINDIFGN